MYKDNIFPRIKRNAVIFSEAEKQPYEGYIVLQKGINIRIRGDGTGTAGDGTDYTCVSRGIGEPNGEGFEEYEVIGWTKTSNVL